MKLTKILSLCSGVSLLLFAMLFPWDQALAQQRGYDSWGMGPGMMGNWGMGWFGMIFMMVFWVLVIEVLVVGLVYILNCICFNNLRPNYENPLKIELVTINNLNKGGIS